MNLLQAFISIINLWRPAFCKAGAFHRAREHAVAALCSFGRHTITSMSIFLGRDHKKPSADYKLYSWSKWKVEDIFNPILKLCLSYFEDDYIIIGADDTKLKKTGKKIPYTSWQRDPMSPHFHVNFIWALRFLQFSVLTPLYKLTGAPCRAIPIRFLEAHAPKRPGKKVSEEEKRSYKELQKRYNLSSIFIKEVKNIREVLDREGAKDKKLLLVCDGSFCNTTCFRMNIDRVHLTARCRKDAKLCKPYQGTSSRRVYIEAAVELLIQAYLDRVQIEFNHREEKSTLGVGEAQVRNKSSVEHQPALCVAAYSALLLASIQVYADKPHADFGSEPQWRPKPKRNSCRKLVGMLRADLLEHPEKIIELGIPPPIITAILRKAA